MGSLLSYGGLVLVAGLVFRANVWAIRRTTKRPTTTSRSPNGRRVTQAAVRARGQRDRPAQCWETVLGDAAG
jgi:hypothetical protein